MAPGLASASAGQESSEAVKLFLSVVAYDAVSRPELQNDERLPSMMHQGRQEALIRCKSPT
jgi:hypothetical protein